MAKNQNKYLIVLTGPTAIGKTDLAIGLNSEYKSSIVSADSRQVYKEMTIGTAKPSQEEIIRHNICLVDHISVKTPYSAGKFEIEAIAQIQKDHSNNQFSILCGGTGLYIQSVEEGLDHFPDVPPSITSDLENLLDNEGITGLQQELEKEDPTYYKIIDKQNARRITRALSIIRTTGKPFSSFLGQGERLRPFKVIRVILDMERQELYDKINLRVDKMIEKGLIEEVETLLKYKNLRALDTVGYREVFQYLEHQTSLEKCIEEIKKNSRRYAKRQMTWLRNKYSEPRFSPQQFDEIRNYIEQNSSD